MLKVVDGGEFDVTKRTVAATKSKRKVGRFDGMELAGIGKQAYFSGILTLKYIFILCMNGFFISFISLQVNRPCITETVHQEHDDRP
mgnify:CR=1 FL=1